MELDLFPLTRPIPSCPTSRHRPALNIYLIPTDCSSPSLLQQLLATGRLIILDLSSFYTSYTKLNDHPTVATPTVDGVSVGSSGHQGANTREE